MADTYLPADVRKRIVDVMRERKMTQRELALRIDVNPKSTDCQCGQVSYEAAGSPHFYS